MDEDVTNLLNSFQECINPQTAKVGGIYQYSEGIIKATVKVLENRVENDYVKLKLEILESKHAKKGGIWDVDVKIGSENVWGIWRLRPIPNAN